MTHVRGPRYQRKHADPSQRNPNPDFIGEDEEDDFSEEASKAWSNH